MANGLVPVKQDITANMYALRAGLSVVSGEVQQGQNAMDTAAANLETAKKESQYEINCAKRVVEHWKEAKGRIDRDYKKPVVKIIIFSILIPICIAAILFVLYLWVFSPSFSNLDSGEAAGIAVTVSIASIIILVFSGRLLRYAKDDRRYFKEKYSQNVEPTLILNEADR